MKRLEEKGVRMEIDYRATQRFVEECHDETCDDDPIRLDIAKDELCEACEQFFTDMGWYDDL